MGAQIVPFETRKRTKGGGDELEQQQDEPEQKRLAEQQGGERTRSRRTFRPSVDIYEVERSHGRDW